MLVGKTLKWSARIIGGLALLLFGAFLNAEGIPDLLKSPNGQLQSIMFLTGFAFIGYLFALFREKEGGYVMVFSGIIMGLTMFFRGGQEDKFMVLVYSVPFFVSGFLFVLCSRKSHPN